MKKIYCLIAIVISTLAIFASEPTPDKLKWTDPLTIINLYVGDYNTAQGKLLIQLSGDGNLYSIELGTDLATTIYASAVTAKTKGLSVRILRDTSSPVNSNEYRIYRILL